MQCTLDYYTSAASKVGRYLVVLGFTSRARIGDNEK